MSAPQRVAHVDHDDARVAQRLKSLAEGKQLLAEAEEQQVVEGRCEKCGCRLPDKHMKVCPKCLKRGLVFVRFLKRTKSYWPMAVAALALVGVEVGVGVEVARP